MNTPAVSFEFFPPRNLDASFRLWDTARALSPLHPDFVSVTYGAGGTTRKLTHEAVTALSNHYGLNVAAHLTCVDASRAETMEIVDAYAESGVREIVALRGDAPKGQQRWQAHPRATALQRADRGDSRARRQPFAPAPIRAHRFGGSNAADVLPQAQDRGGRVFGNHPVLRRRNVLPFSRACAARSTRRYCRYPADPELEGRKFAESCGTSVRIGQSRRSSRAERQAQPRELRQALPRSA